jgi:hypothetical protein
VALRLLYGRAMDTSKAAVCAVATLIGTFLLARSDGPWAKALSLRVTPATAPDDARESLVADDLVADAGAARGTP